jgi:hypothetical protein
MVANACGPPLGAKGLQVIGGVRDEWLNTMSVLIVLTACIARTAFVEGEKQQL